MASQPMPVRVLVVDDDAMSRAVLEVLLAGAGYAVESAESGDTALALLGQGREAPALILTDIQMPGLAGAALAAELRRACGPTTLLLAMSGSDPARESIVRFDGFLLKPFTMQQVAAALSTRNGRAAAQTKSSGKKKKPAARIPPPASNLISIYASATEPASNNGMEGELHPSTQSAPLPQGPEDPGDPDSPVLNEAVYRKLAASMPAQQLAEVYAMCVSDARRRIAAMRRMLAAGDLARFVREAHAIKGGCGLLGANELYAMAAQLESADLQKGESAAVRAVNLLDELAAACDRLERILGSRG
jgi:CheY-like chemotaxis protein/HPt (histidine-containing phosphotransfer) domain-containing protein